MTPDEALRICRLAKAISPAQAVDEYSPEAWSLILADVRYPDAEEALSELGGEREWIHVSHIKQRVKRMRTARINAYGLLPSPPEGLDDAEYGRWLRETCRRIADGELVPRELDPGRPVPQVAALVAALPTMLEAE